MQSTGRKESDTSEHMELTCTHPAPQVCGLGW